MSIERSIQDTRPFLRSDSDVMHRRYDSYGQYVCHQSTKLSYIGDWIYDYDADYRLSLRDRLRASCENLRGKSVLCLGARLGTEVKAFLDRGAFAVGIDLEPGERSQYVLTGDFSRTVFPDDSVDFIFTNSLDHAFDMDTVLSEVARVIKPAGQFVVEIALGLEEARAAGLKEGPAAGDFESCFWKTRACVTDRIRKLGFEERVAIDISFPYAGTHYVFRASAKSASKEADHGHGGISPSGRASFSQPAPEGVDRRRDLRRSA